MFASSAEYGARAWIPPGRVTTMAWGDERCVPQPDTGVSSRGPRTDGAVILVAAALATLIVERIISVHGISEQPCPPTKHVVPETAGTAAT
ncbi:MAG: hypothetical protein ACR2QA_18045 [Solirubrobacteraceae bacterium]